MDAREARLKELQDSLRRDEGRLTPQRLAILRVLAASEDHPSAEDIFEVIKREFPTTSLATVYKTLSRLKELGEIREVAHVDGKVRFDGTTRETHPHLICTSCNSVEDIGIKGLSSHLKEAAEQTGFEITGHRITLFGLCPKCKVRQE